MGVFGTAAAAAAATGADVTPKIEIDAMLAD
jgi:hypothetical protein